MLVLSVLVKVCFLETQPGPLKSMLRDIYIYIKGKPVRDGIKVFGSPEE